MVISGMVGGHDLTRMNGACSVVFTTPGRRMAARIRGE